MSWRYVPWTKGWVTPNPKPHWTRGVGCPIVGAYAMSSALIIIEGVWSYTCMAFACAKILALWIHWVPLDNHHYYTTNCFWITCGFGLRQYAKVQESLYARVIIEVNTILNHIDTRMIFPTIKNPCIICIPEWYRKQRNTINYPYLLIYIYKKGEILVIGIHVVSKRTAPVEH